LSSRRWVIMKPIGNPPRVSTGNTKRIGQRITGQNRGFSEHDINEQMMVGRRPESALSKVENGDISDPNRHVIDVVSVQLTPSHSPKNLVWRDDYLLLPLILRCLAVLGLRASCFLVVKVDPNRLGFLVRRCTL